MACEFTARVPKFPHPPDRTECWNVFSLVLASFKTLKKGFSKYTSKIIEKNAFKLYCIDHVLVAALSISMKENRALVFQDECITLPEGLFCRGDLGRFPSFSARINMYISTLLTRKSTHVSHPMLSYFLRNRHKQTIYYSYRLQPSDLYISYINYIKEK